MNSVNSVNSVTSVDSGTSAFERYVRRLEAHRLVSAGAISEAELLEAVTAIDRAVAEVEGHGFQVTPFASQPELAAAAGLDPGAELWVKDETGNVSGSHKARHLFGVALARRLSSQGSASGPSGLSGRGDLSGRDGQAEQAGQAGQAGRVSQTSQAGKAVTEAAETARPPLAIASCGNAALAAAVVARAVRRPLDVYVPDWANASVVARIADLGGRVVRCERKPGVVGDPAHHAFLSAIAAGAVPFSCQGTETPEAIDGGRTLAYEMADALIARRGGAAPARLDRVLIQVGGGALASAVVTGLAEVVAGGELSRLPVVHAVQPAGNHPLARAWDRLAAELLDRPSLVGPSSSRPDPGANASRAAAASALSPMAGGEVRAAMSRLRESPSRYMTAWEQPPVSYATGILDDITYDWLPIVEAMLVSGGHPVVASERDLRRAHGLAHAHTGIGVCPTGAAGLGGLLALKAACQAPSEAAAQAVDEQAAGGGFLAGERLAVLFTGRMRPGDPEPRPV